MIILNDMRSNQESFTEFALRVTRHHAAHWKHRSISEERTHNFIRESDLSWQKQAEIEASDKLSLDQYLQQYWMQT